MTIENATIIFKTSLDIIFGGNRLVNLNLKVPEFKINLN